MYIILILLSLKNLLMLINTKLHQIALYLSYTNKFQMFSYFCNVNNVPVMCLHRLTRFSSLEGSSFKNLPGNNEQ